MRKASRFAFAAAAANAKRDAFLIGTSRRSVENIHTGKIGRMQMHAESRMSPFREPVRTGGKFQPNMLGYPRYPHPTWAFSSAGRAQRSHR